MIEMPRSTKSARATASRDLLAEAVASDQTNLRPVDEYDASADVDLDDGSELDPFAGLPVDVDPFDTPEVPVASGAELQDNLDRAARVEAQDDQIEPDQQALGLDEDIPEFELAVGRCSCGCDQSTSKNARFVQGHDQRLIGILARIAAAGDEVGFMVEGTTHTTNVVGFAARVFSSAGMAKLQRSIEVAKAKPAEPRVDLGTAVRVKVGRHEYDAAVHGMSQAGKVTAVRYAVKSGEEKVTERFTIL
jgi:hypothetical protein